MLRIVKIVLALSVAAWGLVGAAGNFIAWPGTLAAVVSVTSMKALGGSGPDWRATSNPGVVLAAALFIVVFKLLTAAFCLVGSWKMWLNRSGGSAFAEAKMLALTGCAVAVLGLFVGWVVIGEGWYELWKSDVLRETAAAPAFRYGGFIALIALMIGAPDD